MNWFLFWLFLHILAAVIAFGPIFVFPIVGTLAAKMPQHLPFAVELNHRIERRLVIPLALSMFVSGVGLIWTGSINVFKTGFLLVVIGLYVVALAISIGILLPTTQRVVQIVEKAPQPGPGAPPPEVMTLVRRAQMFGGTAMLLFLGIIFLMIIQPGGIALR
jgi:ABC-type spermidine/putrescine transport system permease subunit II